MPVWIFCLFKTPLQFENHHYFHLPVYSSQVALPFTYLTITQFVNLLLTTNRSKYLSLAFSTEIELGYDFKRNSEGTCR